MSFKIKDGLVVGANTIIDASGNVTVPSKLTLSNTTAAFSSLNLGTGTVSPSTPAAGDFWYNSGSLLLRNASATKTVAYTDSNITGTSSNITGVAAIGNGGTGTSTAPSQGGLVYAASSTTYASSTVGTAGQLLTSGGTGAPTWTTIGGGLTLSAGTLSANAQSSFTNFSIGADSGYTWGTVNSNTTQTADGGNDAMTIVKGLGISLFTNTIAGTDAIKIEHEDTSSAASLSATARTYVSGLTFDGFGHVTAYTTGTESVTDTNWYPTAWAWTNGTSSGPTASLSGTGMSAVSVAALPTASVSQSGSVIVGAQEFGGTKTIRAAASQDGVTLQGRAGGVGGFSSALTPTTLTANRTLTLPDASGTVLVDTNIGSTVQGYSTALASIAGLSTSADTLIYTNGSNAYTTTTLTAAGRALLDDADASAQRTTLGLVIGSNVQAYNANLATISGLSVANNNFIVGNGTAWVVESGATARASLGLGSSATVNVGSSGNVIPLLDGVNTFSGKQTIDVTSAATNTVTQVARFSSQSTGTPAIGIGVGVEFAAETASGNVEIGATIEAISTDVTALSEDFDLVIKTMSAGATSTESLRIKNTGGVTIPSGSTYQINGASVLSSTSLGSSVAGSSLTSVGTISSGTWQGTAIANSYIASALTGKTYNGISLTSNATGFSVAGGTTSKTLTVSNTLTMSGVDSSSVNFSSGGTVAYTSSKLNQFGSTTSAELAGVITDETGSGSLVFATSPTLVTPNIGVATGTSFNSITGLASVAPVGDGTAAVGTSTLAARQDHVHPTDASRAAVGQTMYIGTTAVAINRASAALALTGITSIDGSAATLTTTRNINGVGFNGSANILIPSIYDSNYRRITNPGGAEYVTSTSSITGAIAVTLPVGMVGSMLRFTVKVYEYTTNESFEVHIGGYNYGTGNTWASNPSAYIVGNPSIDRRFTVRFGYTAGGKAVVYIGELASTWAYPQVFVTDIQIGFAGNSVSYTTGWSIGFQATAFENVTATITNSQVGYAVSTNTANTAVLRDGSGNFSAGAITGTSFNSITGLASVDPLVDDGTAAVGTSTLAARQDHVHPTDASRAATNQTFFLGTTSVAINRASAALALTGITSIDGSASKLTTARTINGVSFDGSVNITLTANTPNTLTLGVSGTGLSGSATFNGGSASTFTVTSNATNANTASTIVARDASGNFSAGTITATLSGNASTVTNGVYTTGSYADPTWITSLNYTKLTGTVPTWNQNTTGNASTATSISGGANGSIPYQTAAASTAMLAAGTAGSILQTNGAAAPSWVAQSTINAGQVDGKDFGTFSAAGGVLYATSTTGASGTAAGTSGQVLTSGGAAAPTWTSQSSLVAGSATNVAITDDTTGIGTHYVYMGTATSGNAATKVSSTKLSFQPSTGNLTAGGNITAFSDAALKKDLVVIPDALNKVKQLTGYTFTRIDSGERQTGIIAQDLQKVLPEAVIDNGEHLSVAYGNLVGLLIEAIKELKLEIEELKK